MTGTIQAAAIIGARMITRIFHHVEELNEITEAWEALLTRIKDPSPFQTPLYQRVWWSTLGGGEWEQGEMCVFAGYDQSQRLVGLAPLFLPRGAVKELRLIGSVEISDYLDLIVDPQHASDFVEALMAELVQNRIGGAERMVLDNLIEDSPTISLIEKSAQAHGWHCAIERVEPAPMVRLPSSMDAYLELLESKQRRELKRKMRRAAEYPARVTWRIQDRSTDMDEDIEVFLGLMGNDAEKRTFLTDPMKDHFRLLSNAASKAGWLHLAFLEVSGEPVFGYLNFTAHDRLWVYNSGFNPDHFSLSPGWVLMGHLIEWAIEGGFEAIDFMRGDEDYKYRLGGTDRFVCRLTIEP